MGEFLAEIDYSAITWGERHNYVLKEGRLGYKFEKSDVFAWFDLAAGEFFGKSRRQFHRFLSVGLFALGIPIFTFSVVYFKEGVAPFDRWTMFSSLLTGMGIVGLILIALFRKSYSSYVVESPKGDSLKIYRDPLQPEKADAFIEGVKEFLASKRRTNQIKH